MFRIAMKKNLLFLIILLSGCAFTHSAFDDVTLVWAHGDNISEAKTPTGFEVIPVEVKGLVGPMKFSWRIYADQKNYYLSPIRNLYPGFGNNSHSAKKYGYKVCGINREMYQLIRKSLGDGKTRPIQTLHGLVENAGC